jgi:hypothetical protein
MNSTFRRIVAALIVAIGLAGSVAAGPLEDGAAAYGRGDYATALRTWRPLADQGSAIAQFNLGVMYDNGEGVPRDYAAAVSWCIALGGCFLVERINVLRGQALAADRAMAEFKAKNNIVTAQVQVPNDVQVALRELESTASTYRTLYYSFVQRFIEVYRMDVSSDHGGKP